jgi:dephospho-CoA kinase
MKLVIGLTGSNAAGKGEAARFLHQLGFSVYSLSDIVREEAAALGYPPEREQLIKVGNLLRLEGGAGVLAQRLLPRLPDRAAVDSIRNPAEVDVFRSLPRFILLGIQAPAAIRFKRMLKRARPGDPSTLTEYEGREQQENSADPTAQQLTKTFSMADRIVENDGDLDDLHRKLRTIAETTSEE